MLLGQVSQHVFKLETKFASHQARAVLGIWPDRRASQIPGHRGYTVKKDEKIRIVKDVEKSDRVLHFLLHKARRESNA